MAAIEKSLTGSISQAVMSGSLNADASMSGTLKMADRVIEKDYEKFVNKPSINGVELIKDKSFEELGCTPMKNSEILEIIKIAKGGI